MNTKMIIHDVNRKRVPFCDLKKILLIDDDIHLMNILINIVDIGVASLKPSIIRANFMYIIYSVQYLKIIKTRYSSTNSTIETKVQEWKDKIENILSDKQIKKNKTYHSFIQDILEQIECVLPEELEESKLYKKEMAFENTINEMIKNANDIDIDKLRDVIEKYISVNKENLQWNKIGQIICSLQNKLINAKNSEEETVITEIIVILDAYYEEYRESVTKKNMELFQNYIGTNYNKSKAEFNSWNIQNVMEEHQPFIFTIDEPYSLDLDDALALSQDEYGMTLHVYISNTNAFLLNNPEYENVAFERYSSLYFQKNSTQVAYHMLPQECAERILSLIEDQVRSVVDHAFYIDNLGNVSYNMSYKNIVVNKRLSYVEVDKLLLKKNESEMSSYLRTFESCLQKIYKKTNLDKMYNIPMSESRAQKIVSSAAVLVNYMTAVEAIKNDYLLLYQDYCSSKYSINAPKNIYAKVTSPIRRYSDLKNNYLLNRFKEGNISDNEYYAIEKELQNMIPELESNKERNKQFSKIGTSYFNHKI